MVLLINTQIEKLKIMKTIKNSTGTVIECQGSDENGQFVFRIVRVGSYIKQIQLEMLDDDMEAYIDVDDDDLRQIRAAINVALGENKEQ